MPRLTGSAGVVFRMLRLSILPSTMFAKVCRGQSKATVESARVCGLVISSDVVIVDRINNGLMSVCQSTAQAAWRLVLVRLWFHYSYPLVCHLSCMASCDF